MNYILIAFLLLFQARMLLSDDQKSEKPDSLSSEIEIFSEHIGYTLGKELKPFQGCYSAQAILRGLKKFEQNEQLSSNYSEAEELDIFLNIRDKVFNQKALENKRLTEEYLQNLAKKPSMIQLQEGKLFTEILQKGEGIDTVNESSSPLIHYEMSLLDGTVISNSSTNGTPIRVSVSETIPGFSQGILGMKKKEKRRLYIHPELACRKYCETPVNSLIIVEVEIDDIQIRSIDPNQTERCLQELCTNEFGYTLIGVKPASYIETLHALLYSNNRKEDLEGLIIFLQQVFCNSRSYIFKVHRHASCSVAFELIHIKSLLEAIRNSKKLQNFIRQKYKTTDQFFKALRDPRKSLFQVFYWNDVALGIAFGYGEENSMFYARRCLVGKYLSRYPLISLLPFDPEGDFRNVVHGGSSSMFTLPWKKEKLSENKPFKTLDEEWEWLSHVDSNQKMTTEIPYLYQPIFFITKKDKETKKVLQKYLKARETLSKTFTGKAFKQGILDITKEEV